MEPAPEDPRRRTTNPLPVCRRDAHGTLRAGGVAVLAATATGIVRVVAFHDDPAVVGRFGFRPELG